MQAKDLSIYRKFLDFSILAFYCLALDNLKWQLRLLFTSFSIISQV